MARPADSTPRKVIRGRGATAFLPLALILLGVGLAALFVLGRDYYLLDLASRHGNSLHRRLRPSGRVGHIYAWVGLGLMVLNLLYLLRRELVRVKWLGSMRAWMDLHVLFGLGGAGFILLHSALTLRTKVAIASASALAVVVVTGAIGRWLWTLLPRGADGRLRSHEDVAGEVDRAFMALRDIEPGGVAAVEAIEHAVARAVGPPPVGRISGIAALLRTARVRVHLHGVPAAARRAAAAAGAHPAWVRRVGRTARRIALAQLRADLLNVLEAAGSTWRGLHRVLAVTMLLTASLHISIAIYLGYVV